MKTVQFAAFQRLGGSQHAQAGFHRCQFAVELDENLAGQALRLAGDAALFQLVVGQYQIGAERGAGQHADEDKDEQAGTQRDVARLNGGMDMRRSARCRSLLIAVVPSFCLRFSAHAGSSWRATKNGAAEPVFPLASLLSG